MTQNTTTSVHDVAQYVLKACGPTESLKLMKLVYFVQAWGLACDVPAFGERVKAYSNGPVVDELWNDIKDESPVVVRLNKGDYRKMDESQKLVADSVLDHYQDKSGEWLSALTHEQDPWLDAYEQGKKAIIPNQSIKEYHAAD